ncbi:MAG: Methionine synthase [Phycisphaerae bacterium]|nr:Methionine synthase [Phycisphaerae bacterium]
MADLKALADAVISGNHTKAVELTKQALGEKTAPEDVLQKGLVAGMDEVGRRFKANEFYVPEVLIAARAMKMAMEQLQPVLTASGVKPLATAVIGTVKGDLHDIGKNLVSMMLRGAGFNVVDLGVDVEPAKFIGAAKENNAQLVGLSALLTTTMPMMESVIKEVRSSSMSGLKIMIGGAPVTKEYADKIGADGYAPDAASAVDIARALVKA